MEKVIMLNVGTAIDHRDTYTGQVIESLVLSYSMVHKNAETSAYFANEVILEDVPRFLDFEIGDNKAVNQIAGDIERLVNYFYEHGDLEGFEVDEITSSYAIDTSQSLYSDELEIYFSTANQFNGKELIIHLNCGPNFAIKFSFLRFIADHKSLNL